MAIVNKETFDSTGCCRVEFEDVSLNLRLSSEVWVELNCVLKFDF